MKRGGIKICVYTSDAYLFQKIKLDAPEGCEVLRIDAEDKGTGDVYLCDIDTGVKIDGALTMSRREEADITLPFALGTISRIVNKNESGLKILKDEKCAVLRGERIKLTDVEFALFSLLYENGGNYVSREEVLKNVWNGEADGGIINVYIHYLREKLEKHGEKIILSSRKNGYCIDEKFLVGDTQDA